MVDTAVLKALYLIQSFTPVLQLPHLIHNQMIQWPKLKGLKANYPALQEAMNWVPLLFSFKKRVKAFRSSLPTIQDSPSALLEIHRDQLVEDTFTLFRSMLHSRHQFQQRFHV